jgi:hypothetical protein
MMPQPTFDSIRHPQLALRSDERADFSGGAEREGKARWRGDERNLVVPFLLHGAACLLGEVVLQACHFGIASPTVIICLRGPLNYDQAVTAISGPASLPTVELHFIIHKVGAHEIEIWSMDFACST